MRTIKFRGQTRDADDWVYGSLIERVGYSPVIVASVGLYEYEEFPVMENTVGQFTGLLDGERKDIFEGDIMRIPETETNIEIIGVVEFNRGSYVVRSFLSGTCSNLAWAVRERMAGERRGIVIGNIYDNPELSKGGAQ